MRECSMHAMGIARGNRPSGLRSADGWERVHARIISGIWQRAPVADAVLLSRFLKQNPHWERLARRQS